MSLAVFEETLRRHVMSAAYLAWLVLVALVGLFSATFNKPASMWPSLVTTLAIITGAALIGPEFSTGTLQLIVTKPIRRSVYLLSRVAGVFAAVFICAIVGAGAEVMGRLMFSPAAMPWPRIAHAIGGALVESLLTIALLALLGSLTRSYFNVAVYMTAQISLSIVASILGVIRVKGSGLGAFLEHHPEVERGLAFIDDFFFPSAALELHSVWVLRVLGTAAIALALACLAFRRREVPYGAD